MSQVLTLPEVLERTKISRSALYNMMGSGEFPRPFKLGGRKNGWSDKQIDQWIEERVSESQTDAS